MLKNLLLLNALIFSSHCFSQNEFSVNDGLSMLRNEGAEKARSYFQSFYEKTQNEEAAFYLAWSYFRLGNTSKAEEINNALLESTKDSWTKGKNYYLKGLIAYRDGFYDDTRIHLRKALSEELSVADRQYINVLFGACLLREKEFSKCIDHILRSEVKNGYAWDILSKCYIGTQEFRLAMDFNEKSMAWYKENSLNLHYYDTLSQRGFIRFLKGDLEGGRQDTVRVDEFCAKNEAVRLSYYNAINWILINRCSKVEYKMHLDKVNDFIEHSGDDALKQLLHFVMSWECIPSEEIND